MCLRYFSIVTRLPDQGNLPRKRLVWNSRLQKVERSWPWWGAWQPADRHWAGSWELIPSPQGGGRERPSLLGRLWAFEISKHISPPLLLHPALVAHLLIHANSPTNAGQVFKYRSPWRPILLNYHSMLVGMWNGWWPASTVRNWGRRILPLLYQSHFM